jgi:hypothetical protein
LELYNKQGFPGPTRDRMRKYVGSIGARAPLRVAVKLHSPPILDLKDDNRWEEKETMITAERGKVNIKDDEDGWANKENRDNAGMSSATERRENHVDVVPSDHGVNVDDLLHSDDDSDTGGPDENWEGNVCDKSGDVVHTPFTAVAGKTTADRLEMFEAVCNYDDIAYEDNDIGESVEPYRIWANGCTYSCQACRQFITSCQSQFISHLKARHANLPGLVAYKKAHGQLFERMQQIVCELCGSCLLQDYERIRSHLRLKHRPLTVRDYYERFVLKHLQQEQQQSQTEDLGCSANLSRASSSLSMLESMEEIEDQEDAASSMMDKTAEASPNRDIEASQIDEEEKELNEYKDWVNKCQIR